MSTEKFKLQVEITIEKTDGNGYPSYGERLTTRERFDINVADFMEVSGVLSQFHSLARKIEREKNIIGINDHSKCVSGLPCKAGQPE